MPDDLDTRDEWLDARLRAAARDAERLPRRRGVPVAGAARARRPYGQGLVVALVGLNAVTGAAAYLVGSRLAGHDSAPSPPPGAASASVEVGVPLPSALRGDLARQEGALAWAAGSLWVAAPGQGAVERIDPRAGRVVATVPVGGAGDAATGSFPTAVASDGTSIWATANAEHAVVRIDPATDRVVESIALGAEPSSLAVGGATVWVTSRTTDSLLEVDTRARRVVRTVRTGHSPEQVTVGGGGVWFVNWEDGTVSRLDPVTGSVRTTPPNPAYDIGYVSVAVDAAGTAWAVDHTRGVVEAIDAATMQPRDAIGVGPGGTSIALQGGTAWVVTPSQLTRVDLRAATVTSWRLPDGHTVVLADGAVWVLAGDRSASSVERVRP